MSREIGSLLPPEILREVTRLQPRLQAVPLTTVDDRGFPHVALLSYLEFFVQSGHLHLYLSATSRSAEFLRRRGICTLIFVEESFAYYVKARGRELGIHTGQALFRLVIESVLEDTPAGDEADARLLSGIRFARSDRELEERLALRRRLATMSQKL